MHTEAHPHREIIFVLNGISEYGYRGQLYPVAPGSIILVDAMEPHDFGYPSNVLPGRHLIFFFLHDRCGVDLVRIGGIRQQGGWKYIWRHYYPITSLGLASDDICFPRQTTDASSAIIHDHCVNAIRLLITGLITRTYEKRALSFNAGFKQNIIEGMKQHIIENDGRKCELAALARMAGYNKYYFSRLFHEEANVSFHEFLTQTRIRAFRRKLKEGKSLRTISFELGFAHTSTLCRWRRQHGV